MLQYYWFSNWMNKENIEKRSFHSLQLSNDQENHCWASATVVPELTDGLQSGHTRELHFLHTHALYGKQEMHAFRSLLQSQKLSWPCFISCFMCTHNVWRVSFLLCKYGSLCTQDTRCVSFLLCEYGSLCTHDIRRRLYTIFSVYLLSCLPTNKRNSWGKWSSRLYGQSHENGT